MSLSIFLINGDNGDFRGVLFTTKSSPNTPEEFYHVRRIRFKHFNVLGKYAKNILPHMENTPIDIKLSLYLGEFSTKTEKISDPKSQFYT
jgi:hypothetical protein